MSGPTCFRIGIICPYTRGVNLPLTLHPNGIRFWQAASEVSRLPEDVRWGLVRVSQGFYRRLYFRTGSDLSDASDVSDASV